MIYSNPDVTDFYFILSIFFLVGSDVANASASTSSGAQISKSNWTNVLFAGLLTFTLAVTFELALEVTLDVALAVVFALDEALVYTATVVLALTAVVLALAV